MAKKSLLGGLKSWWSGEKTDYTPAAKWLEIDDHGRFYHYLSSLQGCGTLYSDNSAFDFASNLAEIYIPLDVISDRVAGARYYIAERSTINDFKEGERVENLHGNLDRLFKRPNPFQTMDDLIYQIQFNELATNISFLYPVYTTKIRSFEVLSSVYCINRSNISIDFKRAINSNPFTLGSYGDLVDKYHVRHFSDVELDGNDLIVHTTGSIDPCTLLPKSPLSAASRNINNLLATYSARFNVFNSNGSAGILTRKMISGGSEADVQQFAEDGEMRQKMVDEMRNTDGIVGHKNFIGISSIPLEFIETLGKIKDLEPFKETVNDLITIGSIYGVDKDLLPREDGTTFTNKRDAEIQLWQNVIMPYSRDMCGLLDSAFGLEDSNYGFCVSFDDVPVLQSDRKTELEADILEATLEEKLRALGVTTKFNDKWKD